MEKKRFYANAWDAARREISIFTSRKSNRMHRRLSSVKVELSEKIGSHYVLLKIHIEELWHHQFLASQVCTHLTGNAFRWCSNLVDGKAKHNYLLTGMTNHEISNAIRSHPFKQQFFGSYLLAPQSAHYSSHIKQNWQYGNMGVINLPVKFHMIIEGVICAASFIHLWIHIHNIFIAIPFPSKYTYMRL